MNASSLSAIQRITANLPKNLLQQAQEVTKRGITETLVEALKLLSRQRGFEKAMALKGKLNLLVDLERSREESELTRLRRSLGEVKKGQIKKHKSAQSLIQELGLDV